MNRFKTNVYIALFLCFFTLCAVNSKIYAKQGCCSHHGGVCGSQCCDGTSLTEKCRSSRSGSFSAAEPARAEFNSNIGAGWGGGSAAFWKKRASKLIVLDIEDYNIIKLINGQHVTLCGIDMIEVPNKKEGHGDPINFRQPLIRQLQKLINHKEIRVIQDKKTAKCSYIFIDLPYQINSHESERLQKYYEALGCYCVEYDNKLSLFINASLLKSGFAVYRDKQLGKHYHSLFIKLQTEAKKNSAGLWRFVE